MRNKLSLIQGFYILLVLAAAAGCAIRSMPGYEKRPTLPQVSGDLAVPGLNGPVQVYRDHYGIPHIITPDEHDLFFADGYVQAQDRLWQIVLFRAVAIGTLSEIFGNVGVPGMTLEGMNLSTLEMDRHERVLGINFLGQAGEIMLAKKDPRVLAQLQAYCDGINAFIKQNQGHLPIEFQVLYYQPEPFRPADIIGLSRFYGLVLTGNMNTELTRYAIAQKYGEDLAWKLLPLDPSLGPTIVPKEMLKNRLPKPRPLPPGGRPDPSLTGLSPEAAMNIAQADQAFRSASFFPSIWASNNWMVGPKLTATGAAMLANDSHLYHMEPSLCYLLHLQGAGFDTYGAVLPGMPYVIFGHNRKLSWGITVSGADVQDLFMEKTDPSHPGKYFYRGEWKDFTVRKETIRVRPGLVQLGPTRRFREEVIEIRSTIHGPIINDAVPKLPANTPLLALRWTG